MVVLAMLVVMGCSSAQPTQGGGEPISKVQQAVCSRKWTGVSAGYDHTCATTNDGRLYCWGHNNVGQVSSTLDEEVLSPIMIFNGITGGTGMVVDQVSTAANHTCALVSEYPPSSYSRNLWCWGDNTDKTVGDPNHNPVWSPYHVVTGIVTPVKNVAVGIGNTCIVDANDDLRCWGKRDYCQTGTQSGTPTITPTLAPTMYQGDTWPNTAKQVSVQFSTVCGVGLDDTPRCWGSNTYGNFGSGSGGGYSCTPVSPTSLPFDDSVRDVQVGAGFTCWSDLNDSYLPYCAGHNYYAQLGRGSQTTTSPYYLSTPAAVSDYWLDEGIPLLQLGAGYGFNAVALAEGYVYTWGYGLYGANGDGSTNVRLRPEMVVVGGYPIYTPQVSAGANYDCAISSDGTELWCWGLNSHGQLGDGTTTNRTTPITIACP
jgi:alpha-tubulin suppressor-like RCC1 family protein